MNILVASNNLKTTGLGTFIYTQASELVSRGHNVDIVTVFNGKVGEMLSSHVIELDSVKKSYDLILTNQNDITSELINRNITGYVIFTVHGVAFDFNDCPSEDNLKYINKVVSLSPRIQQLLLGIEKSNYFDWDRKIESIVISQPIDCERFSLQSPLRRTNPKVLSMVRGDNANNILRSACEALDYEYIGWQKPVGYKFSEHDEDDIIFNVEDRINEADIVVGLGRIIYESLSCGRNAIVFDDREYQGNLGDGMVTPDNIKEYCFRFNCSGRSLCKTYDISSMIQELKLYNPNNSEFFRNYILKKFNVIDKVDEYLNL